MLPSIELRLAAELGVMPAQVVAAIRLFDEGASVPFVARYRKEATGHLDDGQLRALKERLEYLRELDQRRAAILAEIERQGKLTDALRRAIEEAETKQRLEDLYLPYRPKRRTKAQIAREAGLEPLALGLHADPGLDPEVEAAKYLDADKGVPDVKAALEGARQILMERFSEDAALLDDLRRFLMAEGIVVSTVIEGKEAVGAKYRDWFAYQEPWRDVPSHRALALFRGRQEEILRLSLKTMPELADPPQPSPAIERVAKHFGLALKGRPADRWLWETARWTWLVKLSLSLESELMAALRARAEEEAMRVFAKNLKHLLLAAPAGARTVIGLDPGIRTGVKVAVCDGTSKLVETATIYPFEPRRDWEGAIATLARLARMHHAQLIAIGNGTASRETERLVADLIERHPELKLAKVVVSEAGASVYSASEIAARELPDVDVSLRGAVSIARRLQDPLAELVKIDPKSIGVGQYQHDVDQTKLARMLDAVVEDCVHAVGVEVNTASIPLLARVSGLNAGLAANIVAYREANGPFRTREALKNVPRLGAKAFEQAAGFLRIAQGDNPLDASSVHPEAYPVVERILADLKRDLRSVIGDVRLLRSLDASKYTDERFGLPTVRDILRELEKPGRDPRPVFKVPAFQESIRDIADLRPGMVLEGVVTNVTNFGAFVDIGVHQDGLVHVSALAERFVKDPHQVVRPGDIVQVKVVDVDLERRRIALSMRLTDKACLRRMDRASGKPSGAKGSEKAGREAPTSAMAAAFARVRAR
ncbi:MAG: RNA-binding transcriptional accessory protein [Rhodocyclaceae bacterium]|nr:RNA-binding transcriptional accessory protein [Rhodocyclaceae bacterium]